MKVHTADGKKVGTIETVEGNVARVKPETGISESIRKRLGWSSRDQDAYELRHSKVAKFDDDAVHLKD